MRGFFILNSVIAICLGLLLLDTHRELEQARRPRALSRGQATRTVELVNDRGSLSSIGGPSSANQLIFVFSDQCAACAKQYPSWQKISEQMRSSDLVETVYVNTWKGLETIPTLIIASENGWTPKDPHVLEREFKLEAVPTTMLLNPRGHVLYSSAGLMSDTDLRRLTTILDDLPAL